MTGAAPRAHVHIQLAGCYGSSLHERLPGQRLRVPAWIWPLNLSLSAPSCFSASPFRELVSNSRASVCMLQCGQSTRNRRPTYVHACISNEWMKSAEASLHVTVRAANSHQLCCCPLHPPLSEKHPSAARRLLRWKPPARGGTRQCRRAGTSRWWAHRSRWPSRNS